MSKHPALYLLLLSFWLPLSAQTWRLAQPEQFHVYADTDGELNWQTHFDSVGTSGQDSVFFPYRWIAPNFYPDSTCWGFRDTAWLGGKIIRKPNGAYLYHNRQQIPIVFEPKQNIGETWQFMALAPDTVLIAEITATAPLNFDGQTESTRTLALHAQDSNGQALSHPADGFELVLCDRHGFHEAPDFFNFPHSLEKFQLQPPQALHQPTLHDFWDFEVGDVFAIETYESSYDGNTTPYWERDLYRKVILDKSLNGNVLVYTQAMMRRHTRNQVTFVGAYNWEISYDTTYYYDTVNIQIDLSSPFAAPYQLDSTWDQPNPDGFPRAFGGQHYCYNSLQPDTDYGRTMRLRQKVLFGQGHSQITGDCIVLHDPDDYSYWMYMPYISATEDWVDGLGVVAWDYSASSAYSNASWGYNGVLRHYQKAGQSWGTDPEAQLAMGIPVVEPPLPPDSALQVFPVPAVEEVTLRWGPDKVFESWEVTLYDAAGRLVRKHGDLGQHEWKLQREALAKGLYWLRISVDAREPEVRKLIFD